MTIDQALFDQVKQRIGEVGRDFHQRPGVYLTEADVMCRLFSKLDEEFRRQEYRDFDNQPASPLHACANFLKADRRLGMLPDIAIFDPDKLTISKCGKLHDRKGYTYGGGAIAIEIKFVKPKANARMKSLKGDLEKLSKIRENHYSSLSPEPFFPLFVIFSRKPLRDSFLSNLRSQAQHEGIEFQFYGPFSPTPRGTPTPPRSRSGRGNAT